MTEEVIKSQAKPISEEELEKWYDSLQECSYDNKDHIRENIGSPQQSLIGTSNERFVITKIDIRKTISMVRQFATIAGVPHSFKVAPTLGDAFTKCKALWALTLSLEWAMQNLVRYSDPKLRPFEEEIQDIADKLDKLQRFSDVVRSKLMDIKNKAGDPDLPDLYQPEKPKPPAPRKPVRFIGLGERKPREVKASKFNLAGLIKKKREDEDS